MPTHAEIVEQLLDTAGTTYARAAGITLRDTPQPLFRLLTFVLLASKPVNADLAVDAAAALAEAGLRSPDALADAGERTVVDILRGANYTRYDESSAGRLIELGARTVEEYGGDLRRLAEAADGDVDAAERLLQEFTGIGPTGAAIFLREVQDEWPWVQPYFDGRARDAAAELGLPTDPGRLAELADGRVADLAAALVRSALDDDIRDDVNDAVTS